MATLGIDLGTSSLKAVIVEGDEIIVRSGRSVPKPGQDSAGRVELDARAYADLVREVIQSCIAEVGVIDGVAIVGQTPTMVLADSLLRPVRPALSWMDARAVTEAAMLSERLGDPIATVGTSLPWAAANLPAKLLWLRRHEADVLDSARWVLQLKDYIAALLTGQPCTDSWSSKGLTRVDRPEPALPVLEVAGLSQDVLPPVRDPWSTAGEVSRAGSEWSGIAQGTVVGVGWSDALAAMVPLGVFDDEMEFVATGTSDIVGFSFSGPPLSGGEGLLEVPAAATGTLTVRYGPTQSSGGSLAWLASLLGLTVDECLRRVGEIVDWDVPTFLPYLEGERAPIWRHDVAAIFEGVRGRHDRGAFIRAVLLGVACSARHVLESGGRSLPTSGMVRLGGGPSRNQHWSYLRAAVLGRPVEVLAESELSALGAALLARAATGCSLRGLATGVLARATVVRPSVEDVAAGQVAYEKYSRAVAVALGAG
ncbi:MAG: FGGY family carbohydrate kinase [Nocardioides sp.]|uniref:xylulokinase n=1 Tax=Nocardioides sp. TaxID=35761 RepID=UPI0039E3C8A0